ncbi:hypothetical protein B1J92_J04026g [Nakaseomyces glabratus]|nr:hypothetical protein B1J91_J04026g [Nakaseomyces glabratus]OXB47329.1 hypothetical protein B1J92_J04026g [Nakaseomyces glabratus]
MASIEVLKNQVDVQIEWLYKGKKRKLPKAGSVDPMRSDPMDGNRLGRRATISVRETMPEGVARRRPRSSSISNGDLSNDKSAQREAPATDYSRRHSVSHSEKEKKKSIFGSLFGKKSDSTDKKTPQSSAKSPVSVKTSTSSASPTASVPININVNREKPKSHEPKSPSSPLRLFHFGQSNSESHAAPISRGSPSPSMDPLDERIESSKHHHSHHDQGQSRDKESIEKLNKIDLKRVSFALDKFHHEPAQQLPSRKPKMGDIVVPEDMISEEPKISVGITTTSDNKASSAPKRKYSKDSQEYKMVLENYKRLLKESERQQLEAHRVAERIANEVTGYRIRSGSLFEAAHNAVVNKVLSPSSPTEASVIDSDPTVALDSRVAELTIDKPIHAHETFFETEGYDSSTSQVNSNPDLHQHHHELPLDVVYTRCCHLREILPIPSTLRQVKGKTAPLQTLKFLNPKPTLIDILSFCDFISITPIQVVVFDNVALNSDMIQIVLSSLINSKSIEKLGIRNVVLSSKDWEMLCKFLLVNKSIIRLDLSQTKIKPDLPAECYRHNMNWKLFCNVLRERTGRPLEELLLNGVHFDEMSFDDYQDLLLTFASKNSSPNKRLGMAAASFSEKCMSFLFDVISQFSVQGVDLGFNELEPYIHIIIDKLSTLPYNNLEYFTLNSSSFSCTQNIGSLLKYLSRLPNLRFLDMSNIPEMFPSVFAYLYKYLPLFPSLQRIHFDSNCLTYKQCIMLCEILQKCPKLAHVSMKNELTYPEAIKDQEKEDGSDDKSTKEFAARTLGATLYGFCRDRSTLLGLDVDYGDISDEIQSRIAVTLMINMKKTIDSNFSQDEVTSQDDLLFDGKVISENAEGILHRLTSNLGDQSDPTKMYLLKKFVEKIESLHYEVQKKTDIMFEKRETGTLPLKEKENLLRLVLLEKNLSNIMQLFASTSSMKIMETPEAELIGKANFADDSNDSADEKNNSTNTSHIRPFLKHLDSDRIFGFASHHSPKSPDVDASQIPHSMATESGKVVDATTGKALLYKTSSSTSLLVKKQEHEEGEFHKWGFFVHQKGTTNPDTDDKKSGPEKTPNVSENTNAPERVTVPKIQTVPSGNELREAIIKAKGIDSIEDLIKKVSKDDHGLKKIYGESLKPFPILGAQDVDYTSRNASEGNTEASGRSTSTDSKTDELVTEKYDELLNSISQKRTSKQ